MEFTKILLGVIFLANFSLFAQKNIQPADIIYTNGDSVSTQIDYENWDNNPIEISVWQGNKAKKINAKDAKRLIINAENRVEIYDGFTLNIDKSPHEIEKLDGNPLPKWEKQSIFLLLLVEGNLNLYYLKDSQDKIHYFIKQKNEIPVELEYKKFKTSSGKIATSEKYKDQLTALFKDCLKANNALKAIRYEKNTLVKAVEEYNSCYGGGNQINKYKAEKEKSRIEYGVSLGVQHTTTNFTGESGILIEYGTFTPHQNWTGGAKIHYYLPRTNERLSLQFGVNYLYFNSKSDTVSYKGTVGDVYFKNFKIAFSYLNFPLGMQYRWKFKKIEPFINIAINNGILLKKDNLAFNEKHFSGRIIKEGGTIFTDEQLRKHEQGMVFGIGARVKHFAIEAALHRSNGMSNISSLGSKIRHYRVQGVYWF